MLQIHRNNTIIVFVVTIPYYTNQIYIAPYAEFRSTAQCNYIDLVVLMLRWCDKYESRNTPFTRSNNHQANIEQTSSWIVQLTRTSSSSQLHRVNGV